MLPNKNGAVDLAPQWLRGRGTLWVLVGFIRLVDALRKWCLLRVKLLLRHFLWVELLLLWVELLLLRVELRHLWLDDLRHLRTGLLRHLWMGGWRVLMMELLLRHLRVELLSRFLRAIGLWCHHMNLLRR